MAREPLAVSFFSASVNCCDPYVCAARMSDVTKNSILYELVRNPDELWTMVLWPMSAHRMSDIIKAITVSKTMFCASLTTYAAFQKKDNISDYVVVMIRITILLYSRPEAVESIALFLDNDWLTEVRPQQP